MIKHKPKPEVTFYNWDSFDIPPRNHLKPTLTYGGDNDSRSITPSTGRTDRRSSDHGADHQTNEKAEQKTPSGEHITSGHNRIQPTNELQKGEQK